MRGLDPAVADKRHRQFLVADQVEDRVGGRGREADQRLAALGAEMLEQPFRIVFQAGNDLAAIQPRCAFADVPGIDDAHRQAEPCRMQRGRQPHDAAADDRKVDLLAGLQRFVQRGCTRGRSQTGVENAAAFMTDRRG